MRLPTPLGSPVNGRREEKWTLHDYVYKNDIDNVKKLITSNDVDVNAVDGKGRTPILIAASFNRCEILETLLLAGCDVNMADTERHTPLMEAVEHGNTDVVRILAKQNGLHVDARDFQGRTALMKAAYYDYCEIVRILLKDACAAPDVLDVFGQSALLLALREGSQMTVECLLRHGCDVTVIDRLGQTALYIAVHSPCNKSLDMAKRIFHSGYDVRNDKHWLLSEAKHNLFYQDDDFYNKLVSLLKNTISDTTNNNINHRTSITRGSPSRRSLRFSFSSETNPIKTIVEEAKEQPTAQSPSNTEILPQTCTSQEETHQKENNNTVTKRRSSKDFSVKQRRNSKELTIFDTSQVIETVSKDKSSPAEPKTPGKSILKQTSQHDANSQTGNTARMRLNSQELVAKCSTTPVQFCVYGNQISVPCDIVAKVTEQPQTSAPTMTRQMSLPAKPGVRFCTQILIHDKKGR